MSAVARIVGHRDRRADRALVAGQLDQLHETAPEDTRRILSAVQFEGAVAEPACGRGAMAEVLKEAGYTVVASDIADFGYGAPGVDFLGMRTAPAPNIMTNAPYGNRAGEAFAWHALALLARVRRRPGQTRKLVLLHRARFLETPKRDGLFDHPCFRLAIFLARVRCKMMHRDGYVGKKLDKSPEFYTAFVWDLDRPRAPGEHWQGVRV